MKKHLLLIVAFAIVAQGKLLAQRNNGQNQNGGHNGNHGGQAHHQNQNGNSSQGNHQNNNNGVSQGGNNSGNQNGNVTPGNNGSGNSNSNGTTGYTNHYHYTNGQQPPATQPQPPAPAQNQTQPYVQTEQNFGGNDNERHHNYGGGNYGGRGYGGNNWHHRGGFGRGENEHHEWRNNDWCYSNRGNHNRYGYFNGRQFYLGYNCKIYPNFCYNIYAIDEQSFNEFMYALSTQDFDSYKREMALDFVRNNYLNSNQVYAILQQFDFESSKLCVAKMAFRNVVDKQNYYEVFDVFDFSSSKYALYQIMNYGC